MHNSNTVSDTKALHYQCSGSTSTFVKLCELGENTEQIQNSKLPEVEGYELGCPLRLLLEYR